MTANKPSTAHDWIDPDDAPDLSSPEYVTRFARASVQRGRPKAATTKVQTTIRLDADIVTRFKADGAGWQSRINDALRQWILEH